MNTSPRERATDTRRRNVHHRRSKREFNVVIFYKHKERERERERERHVIDSRKETPHGKWQILAPSVQGGRVNPLAPFLPPSIAASFLAAISDLHNINSGHRKKGGGGAGGEGGEGRILSVKLMSTIYLT